MRFSAIIVATLFLAYALCDCDLAALNKLICPQECLSIGFTDSNKGCVAPTHDDCTTGNQCGINSSKKACTLVGYVNNADQCGTPTDFDCLNTKIPNQCLYNQSICVAVRGFERKDNGACVAPTDCKAAGKGFCGTYATYCRDMGFTQKLGSDDCDCVEGSFKLVSQNKCIYDASNSVLVGASVLFLIALLF